MSDLILIRTMPVRRIFLCALTPFLFLSEGSVNADPFYFGRVSPIDTFIITAMSSELEAVKNIVNKYSNVKSYISGVDKALSTMNATRYILCHISISNRSKRAILIGLTGRLEQNLKNWRYICFKFDYSTRLWLFV